MSSFVVDPQYVELSLGDVSRLMQATTEATPSYQANERRTEPRRLVAVQAVAQPLSEDFLPDGTSVEVVVRDVSPSGMGLLSPRPISAPYLLIEGVNSDSGEVVVRVLRCREVGDYYDIGGKRLSDRELASESLLALRRLSEQR